MFGGAYTWWGLFLEFYGIYKTILSRLSMIMRVNEVLNRTVVDGD